VHFSVTTFLVVRLPVPGDRDPVPGRAGRAGGASGLRTSRIEAMVDSAVICAMGSIPDASMRRPV
jgi:hypothetical protein